MTTFILKFIGLLFVSSLFIVAFYQLTRHYIITMPDNKERIDGEILKWWSRFFEKTKRYKRVYYSGDALAYKFSEFARLLPKIADKFELDNFRRSLVLKKEQSMSADDRLRAETLLQCSFEYNTIAYFLYIEEPVFLFPTIIRKPFSECVRCMASPFGSAFWLLYCHLDNTMFLWTDNKKLAFFSFWLIFIVLLTWINSFFYSKHKY
jgi:hypothetical protein